MTVVFSALWMLCAIGALVCAAAAAWTWRSMSVLVLAYASVARWSQVAGIPDAAMVGVLAAMVAAIQLTGWRTGWLAAVGGGALAGVWSGLLHAQGLGQPGSPSVAIALPLLVVFLTAFLSTRLPSFAPHAVLQEACLIMLLLGVAVASMSGLAEGWRSAVTLSVQNTRAAQQTIPPWAVALPAASLALGGVYAIWRRE